MNPGDWPSHNVVTNKCSYQQIFNVMVLRVETWTCCWTASFEPISQQCNLGQKRYSPPLGTQNHVLGYFVGHAHLISLRSNLLDHRSPGAELASGFPNWCRNGGLVPEAIESLLWRVRTLSSLVVIFGSLVVDHILCSSIGSSLCFHCIY